MSFSPTTSAAWPTTQRIPMPLASEFVTSASIVFSLLVGLALFPCVPATHRNLSMLYPGIPSEALFVAPALMSGVLAGCLSAACARQSTALGNPSIAFALWISGRIPVGRFLSTVSMQMIGAAAGAFLARAVLPLGLFTAAQPLVAYASFLNQGQAVVVEALATFFVVWSLFSLATFDERRTQWLSPLLVGTVVGSLVFCIAILGRFLTGALAQPAVAVGAMAATQVPVDIIVYVAGPIAGGAFAALISGGPRRSSAYAG